MRFIKSLFSTGGNVNLLAIGLLILTTAAAALTASHFIGEWFEDRAAVKITEAVINKTEAYERIDKKFEKEVKRDLEKVGTDDIFDLIN